MEMNDLIKQLGYPLHTEAIQRTRDKQTHKGYDTDGYGYQFCVNRLNEVLGNRWGFFWEVLHEENKKSSTGNNLFDIAVKMNIWGDNPDHPRSCVGSHVSRTYGDALKGAITNAFKKTAAFWGVGRQAYEGALDDDGDPWPEWAAQNGSPDPDAIKESFTVQNGNGNAQQAQPPKPNGSGNGHATQPAKAAPSAQQNGQAAPPVGNGNEAGLRRRIRAKLDTIFGRAEPSINEWLGKNFKTVSCIADLDKLDQEKLETMLGMVNQLFEQWKAGK